MFTKNMTVTLALDAMGGDNAPHIVLEGADLALKTYPDLHFIFYGDGALIEKGLQSYPLLRKKSTVCHADFLVTSETKPSVAVRRGRSSNLGLAIQAVKDGKAQAVVSAGNTGAYMALAKIILGTLEKIDRPAIPAMLPTIHGRCVMLDLGANVECTPENLVQFALMGDAFASYALGLTRPSIGLLNIGSENIKGNPIVQEAFKLLSNLPQANFYGFVEGDDITRGTVDIVVTDGFTGNIALKSIEGSVKLMSHLLKQSLSSSWRGKLGYKIAQKSLSFLRSKSDPRLYNGAVFLGLSHIAVKSHGGTDALGFANAIQVAYNMFQKKLITSIKERLHLLMPSDKNDFVGDGSSDLNDGII